MKDYKLLILLYILVYFCSPGAEANSSLSKQESIQYLVDLAQDNQKKLQAIDQEIRDVLMKSHNSNLTPKQATPAIEIYSQQLENLSLKRREFYLRQSFIDRLKFKIDQKFQNQELKDFLSTTILEIAQEEATSLEGDLGLTKFCNYLSLAVRQIPERNENLLGFVEGYMNFSTILNPVEPSQFMSHRSYTNGSDSYNATTDVDAENVGELVEERLQLLKAQTLMERASFQQRAPILKPVLAQKLDEKPIFNTSPTEADIETPHSPEMTSEDSALKVRIRIQDVHKSSKKEVTPQPTTQDESNYE